MATNETRHCIFCDQLVIDRPEAKKTYGQGEVPKPYIHRAAGNCSYQFLGEEQTYTEGDSDLMPPSEPQY